MFSGLAWRPWRDRCPGKGHLSRNDSKGFPGGFQMLSQVILETFFFLFRGPRPGTVKLEASRHRQERRRSAKSRRPQPPALAQQRLYVLVELLVHRSRTSTRFGFGRFDRGRARRRHTSNRLYSIRGSARGSWRRAVSFKHLDGQSASQFRVTRTQL